ncbi:MAG: hypothetical protein ACRC2T_17530, partial [Thermoguttaceae bacterium]
RNAGRSRKIKKKTCARPGGGEGNFPVSQCPTEMRDRIGARSIRQLRPFLPLFNADLHSLRAQINKKRRKSRKIRHLRRLLKVRPEGFEPPTLGSEDCP